MDGAMAPENAEFPHHEAWVDLASHGSCEADFAGWELFGNGGMVLASGLFPAVHQGLRFLKSKEGLLCEYVSTGTCSARAVAEA